jgi:hypothetical protein
MVLMLINKGTVKLRKRHKIGISIGEDRINVLAMVFPENSKGFLRLHYESTLLIVYNT